MPVAATVRNRERAVPTAAQATNGNLAATDGPAGRTSYTYDADGRRIAESGVSERVFTYDAAGRLASVTGTEGTTEFAYDGDGNRVGVDDGTAATTLTWDPNAALPMPVTVDDGAVSTGFAWGAAGTPAWATVDAGTGAVLQVPHADQVWTPTVFTDATGAVTHEVSAASWGSARTVTVVDPTAPSPTVAAASAEGLVHMRARDYDPATGQFLTPDPWVRPDGQPWVGVHAYTDGDPVSFWDPDGLRPEHNGCASKRDGRGGPTGCDVEQWVYTNVCKGPASTVPNCSAGGSCTRPLLRSQG